MTALHELIQDALRPAPEGVDPRRAEQGVLLAAYAQTLPRDSEDYAAAQRIVLGMNLSEDARKYGTRQAEVHGFLDGEGRLTTWGRMQAGFMLSNLRSR